MTKEENAIRAELRRKSTAELWSIVLNEECPKGADPVRYDRLAREELYMRGKMPREEAE